LHYSRAGRVESEIKTISVRQAIDEAIQLVEMPDNFTFHIADDMPIITARVSPLIQVFQNLFSNAIKYNDKAAGEVFVIANVLNENYVAFKVRDNGMGIPEEFHERVFQMFHTLHSRDEIESSGMGLSIIKKILENEGGSIDIESPKDGGTCFTFIWPTKPKVNTDEPSGIGAINA
jgi:signal transduction histidine kinase